MRRINDVVVKNTTCKEYTIEIVEREEKLFTFNYSANKLSADGWNQVFRELMRDGSDDYSIGSLLFLLTVVDYDLEIDLPENGLFKFKVICNFAQSVEKALYTKATEVKKK